MKSNKEKKAKEHVPSDDSDELNPQYIFNLTATELLLAIARGNINVVERAKKELANRGMGRDGVWVGFAKAKSEWRIK